MVGASIPFRIECAKLSKHSWPIPVDKLHYEAFDQTRTHSYSKDTFVFKVSPLETIPAHKRYVLYLPTEHHSSVSLCTISEKGLVQILKVGNNHHDDNTPWGYPRFGILGGNQSYYLVTTFRKGVYFPIRFMTEPEFRRFEVKGNFGLGMFYGMSTIIFLANWIFFIFFRDKIFSYYGIFQAFIIMSIASSDGLFTFFTDSPYFLNYSDIPLHVGLFVSGFFFAKNFIKNNKIFSRISFSVIIAAITCLALMFFYIQSGEVVLFIIAESVSFIMLSTYFITALTQFKINQNARFYVYAYSLYLFFAIEYYVLRQIGLPITQLFSGQLKVSCLAEMIVLLTAMMMRAGKVLRENHYFRNKIEEHIKNESDKKKLDLHIIRLKYNLTERETEVLECMSRGMSNPEIAKALFISLNTVKYHIRNIFLKMEISSRGEAISMIQPSL